MPPKLKRGTLIGGFKLIMQIGRGGYSNIFYVQDQKTEEYYAMKIEKCNTDKRAMHFEQKMMKELHYSVYLPRFVKYGRTQDFRFLVMELFGPSLEQICLAHVDEHLSLSTVLRISIEMLRCIMEVHNQGFIHRDVKPSNFLIRKSKRNPIVLVDFGLSRRYRLNNTNEVVPVREHPGYVGTNMFASLNAYRKLELSQRDDLMSWLYSVIKMRTGRLPWDNMTDKSDTYDKKIQTSIGVLLEKMPRQYIDIHNIIESLSINESPDYEMIMAFTVQAIEENGCSWDDPFDWELMSETEIEKISVINISTLNNEEPNIPMNLPTVVVSKTTPDQIVKTEKSDELSNDEKSRGCANGKCIIA